MTMRTEAPWLLILSLTIWIPSRSAADSSRIYGKPAEWETTGEDVKPIAAPAIDGESIETPNQKRRRMGVPIESSYPALEIGKAEETPNHRRERLGPASAQAALTDYYVQDLPDVAQETGNRLAERR